MMRVISIICLIMDMWGILLLIGASVYGNGTAIDSITGIPYSGQILLGWRDTLYEFFDSTTHNPDAANYTNAYYDMFEQYGMELTIYIWIWS